MLTHFLTLWFVFPTEFIPLSTMAFNPAALMQQKVKGMGGGMGGEIAVRVLRVLIVG